MVLPNAEILPISTHDALVPKRRIAKVRMKDVAEHAGVSTRTVSNVVNNFVNVSPQMRDLVQRSLIELGYQMDYVART